MINIIKKILAFSYDEKDNLIKGTIWAFINCVFKISSIMAVGYAIMNIVNGTLSKSTSLACFAIVAVGLVGMIFCTNKSSMAQTIAGYTMAGDSRIRIGSRLKNMPMGYFNDNNLGKITSATTNSAEFITANLTKALIYYFQGIFMSIVIAVSLFIYDARMAVLAFVGIVLYFITTTYQQKYSKAQTELTHVTQKEMLSNVLEYLQGISVVKSYNLVGKSNKKIKETIEKTSAEMYGLEIKCMLPITLQAVVFKVISFAMIALSIWLFTVESMELMNAVMMIVFAFLLFSELENSSTYAAMFRLIESSIDDINSITSGEIMTSSESANPIKSYDIKVDNVSFSYENKKVLDGVSVDIPYKTSLAIVGGSGSGKTTLCNLITRFWDVDSGVITVGGEDISQYMPDKLLASYSMVFQNVYLFNDTVAENIRLGKQDATDEEIIESAKKAYCHDFIMSLPDGYNTILGEGGASISGGEKQRISIARAIIKDSPIIILDEATANVDPENEHYLQQAISSLTESKTVIMIAHRLKTVQNADNIIVLKGGKIVESGIHGDLLSKNGEYAKFVGMRQKAIGWKLGREIECK